MRRQHADGSKISLARHGCHEQTLSHKRRKLCRAKKSQKLIEREHPQLLRGLPAILLGKRRFFARNIQQLLHWRFGQRAPPWNPPQLRGPGQQVTTVRQISVGQEMPAGTAYTSGCCIWYESSMHLGTARWTELRLASYAEFDFGCCFVGQLIKARRAWLASWRCTPWLPHSSRAK